MRKVLLLVCLALVAFCGTTTAQTYKFGHINTSELINVMPEKDSAMKKLEAYTKDMSEVYEEAMVEYNKKVDEFSTKQATWSETVKTAKQKDLMEIQRRLQEQQQAFEPVYQEEQRKLFGPIQEKVRTTITKVAKAQGLIYVFDIAGGSVIYFNEVQSVDILPLVKKEMGIK